VYLLSKGEYMHNVLVAFDACTASRARLVMPLGIYFESA
jgi:hypothetical protein